MEGNGFTRREHDRTLLFGRGRVAELPELVRARFTLLGTGRSLALPEAEAPLAAATATVEVPAGQIDEIAATLLERVPAEGPLVALGGGRVIDAAKAIAAATGGREVIAIPTSLSGAEMTGVHRHARGTPPETRRVRPTAVINDPALSASLPVEPLAASSANALAHAVSAALATTADPIAATVAVEAVARIADGWTGEQPDRDALALGALMAGWALDRTGLGVHHALAQTAVRTGNLAHAATNAALLPFTTRALRSRHPARFDRLDAAAGGPVERTADRLAERSPVAGLDRLTRDPATFRALVTAATRRSEPGRETPPFEPAEIESLYRSAARVRTETDPTPSSLETTRQEQTNVPSM